MTHLLQVQVLYHTSRELSLFIFRGSLVSGPEGVETRSAQHGRLDDRSLVRSGRKLPCKITFFFTGLVHGRSGERSGDVDMPLIQEQAIRIAKCFPYVFFIVTGIANDKLPCGVYAHGSCLLSEEESLFEAQVLPSKVHTLRSPWIPRFEGQAEVQAA